MPETTTYLKNYKAPAFTVDAVSLDFDIYDDYVLVTSTQQLVRQHPGALELSGDTLELVSLEINGSPLAHTEYRLQNGNLVIPACPNAFTLHVVTRIFPQSNTQLSGLYRSKDLLCTQCEAQGFRRMTFFLDRPDVLATYETRICADKARYPVLLSNGNLIDSGESSDGRHWVLWQDPFKKPSYLFALVAGKLARVSDVFTTASQRKINLHFYVEPGNEDKCQHAMNALQHAMRWDEQVFGLEYDLDTYMVVAVSDFNMGAMENKGLNLFNAKYILAKPDVATDQDFADIAAVVGHEYFHNWTGNRVTCRDWFQLSLKEGLTVFREQSFSQDMYSKDVCRIRDVKTLLSTQFPEDAGAMAHPVRPEAYREINNFYTATVYNKGAEVIRMQHTLLGKAGFRRGMDLYFERHDGCAVTIDDFVKAMEDANAVDLTQFKRWYSQAGTPKVQVKSDYTQHCLKLTLQQCCPQTPDGLKKKPFHIPIAVALFDSKGKAMPIASELLELKETEQVFLFEGLSEKPVVSLLRGFSAPIKLQDALSQEELFFLLAHETDGYAQWDAAQRLILQHLHECLKHPDQALKIPAPLIKALCKVMVDESLDPSLRAELLTPPSFEECIMGLRSVDVDAVEAVRDAYREQLGNALQEPALSLYKKLWQAEDNSMQPQAFGRRKLRNVCLWLLMKSNAKAHVDLCKQQFDQAKTMTDQIGSFSLLANASQKSVRTQAIKAFFKQWQHNDLVMAKWFSIQAASEVPHTLQAVQELLQHPLFSMANPNKVRALVGTFCFGNPRHFHAVDGSGYAFLTTSLRALDTINPQVAARLASPFTQWQRFDKPRRVCMWQQLEALAQGDLSVDLREVVDKSLVIENS